MAELKLIHKQWADLVISGVAELEAYMQLYPNAAKKTAHNQLSNFRQNLGIMGYLNAKRVKIAEKVDAITVAKLSNELVGQVLTKARKQQILEEIAEGKLEFEKLVMVRDTNKDSTTYGKLIPRKMMVKPDLHERMKAIELDNRMSGDIYRAKSSDLIPDDPNENDDQDIFKNLTIVFRGPKEE